MSKAQSGGQEEVSEDETREFARGWVTGASVSHIKHMNFFILGATKRFLEKKLCDWIRNLQRVF